jgi:predicted SAM-dependent methyltransferase
MKISTRRFIKRLLSPSPSGLARSALRQGLPLRVVLGSNNIGPEGWILTNVYDLDITRAESWARFCPAGSIDNLFCEHVLEHIAEADTARALALAFYYLKTGGCFRIAVPDGHNPDEGYIDAVKVNGSGPGAEDHKVLYTIDTLRPVLEAAGFVVKPLEYFDEDGNFHAVSWLDDNGRVIRSRRYTEFRYSSLIVDALKPA